MSDKQSPVWVRPGADDYTRSPYTFALLLQGDVLDDQNVEEELELEGDMAVTWTNFVLEYEGDQR